MPEFLIFFLHITFLFYFISQNYSYRIQNTLLIVSSSNVKGRVISTTITCGSANAYRQKGSNDDSTFILFTFYFISLLFCIVPSLSSKYYTVCFYLILSRQLKYFSYFFVVKYVNLNLRFLR